MGAAILALMTVEPSSAAQTAAAPPATSASAPAPAPAPAASAPGAGVPGMPSAPSTAALESKRPKCEYRITRTDTHLMEKCRVLWEDYLRFEIEGYRRSFQPYVAALNRLDQRLQRQVPKELSATQYEEYRAIIADEIAAATVTAGAYMVTYREYVESYRRQVRLLQDHHKKATR